MIGRYIQCLEVVVIGLHFGTVNNIEAHGLEDVDEIVQHYVQRVQTTLFILFAGHGDIQRFSSQTIFLLFVLNGLSFSRNCLFQLLAQLVDQLTHDGTLLGRESTHTAQQCRDRALLTHIANTELL